ncbi:hypothetical protein AGMMS50249_6770 [candidate division SR1 bacterium]|nr:hypothetical protein AGMMS50249_6770 [candidate division SR1 bacterium]
MKKLYKSLFLALLLFIGTLFLAPILAQGFDVNNIPALERYVTDFTDTLSVEQLNELESIAETYSKQTTNQLVTVIIPDRGGYEMFDIGMKIFNENGIGNRDNDGLLLLIAKSDKKIRIIVGYGLEDEMPDLKASKIIEESVRPLVDEGEIFEAVKAFYEESIFAIDNPMDEQTPGDSRDIIIFIALAIGIIIGSIVRVGGSGASRGKGGRKTKWIIGVIILIILSIFGGPEAGMGFIMGVVRGLVGLTGGGRLGGGGGSGGGGGGRSGGGFSGGGGRSGGGGAGD